MPPPDPQRVLTALRRSPFRRKFALADAELAQVQSDGIERLMQHARRLLDRRLAPAEPENDGRQTPWRGHPVFIAQHATATCCRGCLQRWHRIPAGRAMTEAQMRHVLAVLRTWIEREAARRGCDPHRPAQPTLFE